MPFEKARLFNLVEGRPLPSLAQELGIQTWAQYFLKWVISNPAVTCVLPATSNPKHIEDNMRAQQGALPDEKMRQRMLAHVQALPGFDTLARAPWYPDKHYSGVIGKAQSAIRALGG
jgi:diketogulonate reductase-like aldo/keto reductase